MTKLTSDMVIKRVIKEEHLAFADWLEDWSNVCFSDYGDTENMSKQKEVLDAKIKKLRSEGK